MRACFAAACFLWVSLHAVLAGEGKALPPPLKNLPWVHESTGLRLPAELAKMVAEQVFQYETEALGCSVRYSDRKARMRGDVYVYPCPKKATTAEEIKPALRESAGSAVWEIEEMQKRGNYKNVKLGEANYQSFDLIPKSAGVSALVSLPMKYVVVENGAAGDAETTVGSFLGVMLLKGFLVKVRITYPVEGAEKEQNMLDQRVTDFINAARHCVLDPGLREQAAEQIEKYRRDPLSEAGRDVAGAILAYAEITPMITLTIDGTISTMGKDLEKLYPEASIDLLRAFIVGAVAETLKKPGKEAADLPQAGAAEMLHVYDAMQKARPGLSSNRLTELETAVNAKRAAAWFREQSAEREK